MSTRSISRGLYSDNPGVVARALRQLARRLGTRTETGARPEDFDARKAALAERDVEPRLLELADHDDDAIRELAVDGLAAWLGDGARSKLLERCMDPVQEVRASAVGGLEGWPDDDICYDNLVAAMDDAHWHVRWRAARALGHFHGEDARYALFRSLLDSDSNVRTAAAEALERHPPETVLPRLRGFFDHPTTHLMDSALELMGEIGGEDDARFLAKVGAWTNLSQPAQVKAWARRASKRIKQRLKGSD